MSQKTVAELKEIASARNLSFTSKVKKADLVALIVQNQ
ncbi:MAG: HeH/LEM domain-containing protein [Prochlorothrix sp.]